MTDPCRLDPVQLRAFLLQGRVWLCGILLWLAEALGDTAPGRALRADIEQDLHTLRRTVRCLLICLAGAHRPARSGRASRPGVRPVNAPPGFRRQRRGNCIRHVTRVTRWRGRNLRGHIEALRAVIDRVDDFVPRVRRRLGRSAQRAPVIVAARPAPCVSLAGVTAPVADSS